MADSADYWSSKDDTDTWASAMTLFQEGYELQTQGLWAEAMACYRDSIRLHPIRRGTHVSRLGLQLSEAVR